MSKLMPPKVKLMENMGYYHLFIEDEHNPKLCPACIEPGLWLSESAPSPQLAPKDRKK